MTTFTIDMMLIHGFLAPEANDIPLNNSVYDKKGYVFDSGNISSILPLAFPIIDTFELLLT